MRAHNFLTVAFGLFFTSPLFAVSPSPNPRELVLQAPPAASVNSVAVSPDGSIVATAANEGGIRLYDAGTGDLLRCLGEIGDRGVAFSPDGRHIASAGFHMDKLVGMYDVRTGRRVRSFAGHSVIETTALAFSPDGRVLASAARDGEILVWEMATGSVIHRIEGHAAITLAFSPDSTILASGGNDKTVRFWDAKSGQLRRTLEGHDDCIVTLTFSPDGKRIATGSCDWSYHRGRDTANFAVDPQTHSQWKLWDTATGDVKRTVTEPGRMLSLAIAPDGETLACGVGKDLRIYDLRRETPGHPLTAHDFAVTSVAFTRDGGAVITASHDQTVKRVVVPTGRVEWHAAGSFEQVNSVALSRDATLLATGSSDRRFAVRTVKAGSRDLGPGAVRLWDARTGRLLRRLGDPTEQIMAVAISPDGRLIAAGGANKAGLGVLTIWDGRTGAAAWSVNDHSAEVLAVAFAPDGSLIATAGADGLARLRNPATGAVVRTLEGHRGGATSLAFSADGATLLCGEGHGGTRVWGARTGRLLHTCKAEASQAGTISNDRIITSVAFTPDGQEFLACAASVGNTFGEPARIWDVRTGALKRELREHGRPMVLSPDGNTLAVGGKSVSLYDLQSGKPLRRLIGHLKKVQSIAFSADGRLVISGGSYGTNNIWEVATGRLLVTLHTFPECRNGTVVDEWLAYTGDGFYDGSPGVNRFLALRVGDELQTPKALGQQLHRPDRVESSLRLDSQKPAAPSN